MITSFEVGAVFKIINEASPQFAKILKQVRELQAAIDKAKASISGIAKLPALASAISETQSLAGAWSEVAKAASAANRAIGRATGRTNAIAGTEGAAALTQTQALTRAYNELAASMGAVRSAGGGPRVAGPGGGGGGNIFRPGARGGHGGSGGGMHVIGPGVGLPGGGHLRFGGLGGGLGMAGLGLLGYGVAQSMSYDDAVVLMAQHAGVDLATNRDKFRKMLEDAAIGTGFGEHDVSLAAQQELRMFGDTGGSNGVNVLPKMLRYAATEARLKGTSLEESMSSLTGLAHMLQAYSEEDVGKLAPAFSALSVRSPMTLAQQEKAFGYAVPLLHAAMDLDSFQTMAASTALARAGITSTKAGTWVRQMMKGAMPGTSIMTKALFKKHESALKELGLVDDSDKPTWFTNDKPDEMKFLETVSENLPKIDITRRAALLQSLAGTQGAGALAVLAEPAVQKQMQAMYAETQNPANVNRVRNFMSVYNEQSSLQNARTTLQTFNVLMADLGDKILPSVNGVLRDFKSILEGIRDLLPKSHGGKLPENAGTRALEGAGMLGTAGFFMGGPVGALGGAVAGGVLGVAESYMEQKDQEKKEKPVDRYLQRLQREGAPQMPSINFSLNVDGRTLAQAIVDKLGDLYRFDTNSPAANGAGIYGP